MSEEAYIALIGKKSDRDAVIAGFDLIAPGLNFVPNLNEFVGKDADFINSTFTKYINVPKLSDFVVTFDDESKFRE